MADQDPSDTDAPSNPLTRLIEAGLQLALTLIAGVFRGLIEAFRRVFAPGSDDPPERED